MPTYRLLQAKGHQYGLNDKARAGELAPGSATVADNVEFDRNSIREVRGSQNVCLGGIDDVQKGGPVASSLYVQGDPWWLEHPEVDQHRAARAGLLETGAGNTRNSFRSPFHARQGVIVIPEGSAEEPLALNPISSGTDWAIEFSLWTDDLRIQQLANDDTGQPMQPIVVMTKGWSISSGQNYQWQVVIKTDAADVQASGQTFYVSLEIFPAGGGPGNPESFQYESGGNPASFFYPGERIWFAFAADVSATTITSYYKRQGQSVVSSSQNYSASTLDTAGNIETGGDKNERSPIIIGGRASTVGLVRNFNGSVPELRFYDGSTLPTWDGSYAYYDRELTDAEVTSTASATDLDLYWSLSKDRVVDGQVLPRYTTGTAQDNAAWLSGSDARWVNALGALGSRALSFLPSGPASPAGQTAAFYRALVSQGISGTGSVGSLNDLGPEMFASGIRVPNGDAYLRRQDVGASKEPEWLDQITVAVAFTVFDIEADHTQEKVLWQQNRVLQGTANHSYQVQPCVRLAVVHSGGAWRIEGNFRDSPSAFRTLTGTTALAANQRYVATLTLAFDSGNFAAHLYLDGVQEQVLTAATTKPAISQPTSSLASGSNANDDDRRDYCYPTSIGCSLTTLYAGPPLPRNFMFGAEYQVGNREDSGAGANPARRWWAFHRNLEEGQDLRKTVDSGVGYRGYFAHRGLIGWIGVWSKKLTETEVNSFSSAPPSDQAIRGYGQDLLSLWLMDEGSGSILNDKGSLGNHLRIHPESQVRGVVGPVGRTTKSQLYTLAELRTRTPREGIARREVYGLSDGSIVRLVDDGSGGKTWSPISSYGLVDPSVLGTTFQYSDFLYWCPGHGPVLRISRNRVTSAGITPSFSSRQNDHFGWQEGDRDGTFQIVEGGAGSVFASGSRYSYAVTFYDPESGTESPPSRRVYWICTTGLDSLNLDLLPCSHDRHVKKYRIYRTSSDGGVWRFVDEIPIQPSYVDNTPDTELGAAITSDQNYPPPQSARIGVQFGSRALYAGVPDQPATLFASKEGFPEACPIEYQITVTSGKSSEITGIHVMHGRALIFLQDTVFQLADGGGDIGAGSLSLFPLQIEQVSDQTGCVNHHTQVYIDQVGLVFAGERGLYVTGDGVQFQYVSERVETFWENLDKSTWRTWHAVHWRKRHQYILFCSDGTTPGRNNRALVWDYSRNAFSTRSGVEARDSLVVEDEVTGEDRLYVTDYLGQTWELDTATHNFGVTRAGFSTTSGTLQSGSTATVLELVGDASLPVAADGLRGVPITVNGETRYVASNTTGAVTLDGPLSATPATNDPWRMGLILSQWTSGEIDYGDPTKIKRTQFIELDVEPNAGSTVDVDVTLDGDPPQSFEDLDMSTDSRRFGPVMGRGRHISVSIVGDEPDQPWEVLDVNFAFHPKGRARW